MTKHPRLYEDNRYVYPVLSRRSKGISVGINLNPDKVCNFDCIYCQVDRTVPPVYRKVNLDILERELRQLLAWVDDGTLFRRPPFTNIPDRLKRVNDIAFSGDGEPTSYPRFLEVVELAGRVRDEFELSDVKLIVITNCTLFHRPHVKRALAFLDQHNGEIWAKLDAGTAAYYHLIDRTRIPFDRVVRNIVDAAKARPVVIQSLFMRVHGEPPSHAEIEAYCGILNDVLTSGGGLKLIQLYTIARRPTEPYVTPLSDAEMDALGEQVGQAVDAPVEVYYGVSG
ncbi:MAG: radical SAM protein [Candidatus Latescibacteria bacterium]|nr:radical SAM protein [Candidatus Latescibacterota bacterium]